MIIRFFQVGNFCARILVGLLFTAAVQRAGADQIVYDDTLENGWQDWGWATRSYTNTSPVHSGSDSISVTIVNGWDGIQIYHPDINSSIYANISFWLNGGSSGGQHLQMYGLAHLNSTNAFSLSQRYALAAPPANNWQQYSVPLSALGVANITNFTGFVIQDSVGTAEPTFYVDDISLVSTSAVATTGGPVTITVNAQLNRHAISPQIYGTAFATSNQLADLNFTMNRSGGNAETSYNWQLNAHNHAADWYFESIDDGNSTPGNSADAFVANSKLGGAQAMITIPMIGWAPILGPGRGKLASYSIAKYGPQTGNDWQWMPDAGNGVGTNSATRTSWLITTNDPNDANTPVNSAFEQGYVQHLMNNWGASTNGGVSIYLMDNEHSLWQSTHQDIHPVGPTMQEILNKIVDYAGMVKSNDPNALVCGPEEWGWNGYFYSGYDQQWAGKNNWNPANFPDRNANGGMDYMPWLLSQLHQHDTNAGVRLLDYFTLHCYPQEGNVGNNATDTATVLLRAQSTRQFWDTSYVDPSWINNVIMLIPRMKNWVMNYYPGTKIGVTEYNWGAEPDISGATAQADILGIFGRENLDLATRWTTPDASTPTYKAMKIYRNYDGNKATFGDTSVSASGPNPDYVATFAATRSTDGALTIIAINKQIGSNTPAIITLTNFLPAGTAQVWQLTSANAISRSSDINFTGGTLSNTLPAQSVTLFVLPAGTPPSLQSGAVSSTNTFSFLLNGQTNQHYAILTTSNLLNWQTVQTNLLASSPVQIILPATNTAMFYRAQWLP